MCVGVAPLGPASGQAHRTRPLELKDPLNRYLYHPLAARLARGLQTTGVSPNAVSVAGMVCAWAAAWAFAALAWPLGAALGFGLLLLWHVLDGTDGDLARLTGKASPTGELVDGLCDYGAQVGLYLVLAALLQDDLGGWAWALAAFAGLSHAVQANHAESYRRWYLWWAYGVPWLKHAGPAHSDVTRSAGRLGRAFSPLLRLYLHAAERMAPEAQRLDTVVSCTGGDTAGRARIARLVRGAWRAPLRFEKILGPNPRTILLGISMLAGSPLWFFLGELVLLNAILAVSIARHNAVIRDLLRRLGPDRGFTLFVP